MNFELIYDTLTKSSLWHDMLNTRENSPYHREENVAVHTRMTLEFYRDNFASRRSEEEQFVSKVALLFHDVGKPKAATPKDDRTIYRGHELISANIFEDFILKNQIKLDPILIRKIKWLIENHLPYNRKNRDEFRIDMTNSIGEYINAYKDVLISDACGRISDNPKIEKVQEYIDDLYEQTFESIDNGYYAYFLHGASGSGKTSLRKDLNGEIFCLDDLREQFFNLYSEGIVYKDPKTYYKNAFDFAIEKNDDFNNFIYKKFMQLVKSKKDIIFDATFSGVKSRRKWINELKRQGYYIIGFEFQRPIDLLFERQYSRTDKFVPKIAIENQYYKRMLFRYGSEVDLVRLV